MKPTLAILVISLLLNACTPAVPVGTLPPALTATTIPTTIPAASTSARVSQPSPTADPFTRIQLDGKAGDWGGYPALFSGSAPANSVTPTLRELRAFSNDRYFYLLIALFNPHAPYKQIDIDLDPSNSGMPPYMLNLTPQTGGIATHLGKIVGGKMSTIQDAIELGAADFIELRIPLSALGDKAPQALLLRIMDGTCCDSTWHAISSTPRLAVTASTQREYIPDPSMALQQPDSAFCIADPLPTGVSKPVEGIHTLPGYVASYLVPPSGLNVPSDLAAAPDGTYYVASSRSNQVFRVSAQGQVSPFARVNVYTLDVDASGQLYGYFMPGGEIYRINAGNAQVIGRMPPSACESTLAAAPQGDLYIGFNQCPGAYEGKSGLYLLKKGEDTPRLLLELELINALDFSPGGELLLASGNRLLRYDPAHNTLSELLQLPGYASFHGLVSGPGGLAYVSVLSGPHAGSVQRIRGLKQVDLLANTPEEPFEGLELSPTGEVIGVQRATGGMQRVGPDGTLSALVKPNGLVSPQTLAVSPCGDLLVVEDEGGSLGLIPPNGSAHPFTSLISFQPPQTTLAFSNWGWYATAESAPGFPSLLRIYSPNQHPETLAEDIPWLSGVGVDAARNIYASSSAEGRIYRFNAQAGRSTLASGLDNPLGMALGADGAIYFIYGGGVKDKIFFAPIWGQAIGRLAPDGSVSTLTRRRVSQIAFGPDGLLYGVALQELFRVLRDGRVETVASGFQSARGLAFGIAGQVYIADDEGNDIVQLIGPDAPAQFTGRVVDGDGAPLTGVRVRLTQDHPPFAGAYTRTDANGWFSLSALPDSYTLHAWLADGRSTQLQLSPGQSEVELRLK